MPVTLTHESDRMTLRFNRQTLEVLTSSYLSQDAARTILNGIP
jgi:hypothetical protein